MAKVNWKSNEQLEQERQEQEAASFRRERDRALRESDWTQLPDAPLNEKERQEKASYRQGLRDATSVEPVPYEEGKKYAPGTLVSDGEHVYVITRNINVNTKELPEENPGLFRRMK